MVKSAINSFRDRYCRLKDGDLLINWLTNSEFRIWLLFSAIVTLSFFPGKSCGEEVVDSICAIVDEEIILESEVSYGINSLLLERGIRFPTPAEVAELRKSVLGAYVTQKVLLARAVEETLDVEDRVIDRELERKMQALVSQVGSEEKLVEYFERPLRQIRNEMRKGVRQELLIDMLKQRHMMPIYVRRQEVVDFYMQHYDELPKLTEQVSLSHILIKIKNSESALSVAVNRINEIIKLLEEGSDFDSLARERSDDTFSSENGGRLGFMNRGDLVPEYETVAYALEKGEVSGMVESSYGFHVIRLIERQGERISTQHILVKLEPTADDHNRWKDIAEDLRNRIIQGEDFSALASEYSEDPESSGDGGKLPPLPVDDLPDEFSSIVEFLEPGETSRVFETSFGFHLIRLDEHIPQRGLSLNEDWQTIEQFALNMKRENFFQEWVQSLKADHYFWPDGL